MRTKTIAVIGATGVVGQGIVSVLAAAGHHVICIGRRSDTLSEMVERYDDASRISAITGSVASAEQAHALAEALREKGPDVIVTTINGETGPAPVFELSAEQLESVLRDNLVGHLQSAQHLIPLLPSGGLYLGIGGGMADLLFPKCAAMSMAQAAQRVLFRYLAEEGKDRSVTIRELMLYFMITAGNTAPAEPHCISAEQVGRHVAEIIAEPELFKGPVLALKSKKQIGLPDVQSA